MRENIWKLWVLSGKHFLFHFNQVILNRFILTAQHSYPLSFFQFIEAIWVFYYGINALSVRQQNYSLMRNISYYIFWVTAWFTNCWIFFHSWREYNCDKFKTSSNFFHKNNYFCEKFKTEMKWMDSFWTVFGWINDECKCGSFNEQLKRGNCLGIRNNSPIIRRIFHFKLNICFVII